MFINFQEHLSRAKPTGLSCKARKINLSSNSAVASSVRVVSLPGREAGSCHSGGDSTHDLHSKVTVCFVGGVGGRTSQESHDMEVKGHLITSSGLGSLDPQSSDLGSKLRSDHIAELLDRKRALQSALSSRLVDLKKLCLQEAELTGELPNEYPLQSGERPPHVRRRVGGSYRVPSTLNAKGEVGGMFY
ncbi:FERM domain-containing protein 4A [Huso huso]|uniref:FERM domain-containing protein 4A n=1 Tax=Huso huso TaxID=61971 RepID=A0ABR0Y3H5_HUSHU